MADIRSKASTEEYRNNFDAIFGAASKKSPEPCVTSTFYQIGQNPLLFDASMYSKEEALNKLKQFSPHLNPSLEEVVKLNAVDGVLFL